MHASINSLLFIDSKPLQLIDSYSQSKMKRRNIFEQKLQIFFPIVSQLNILILTHTLKLFSKCFICMYYSINFYCQHSRSTS